MNRLAIVAGLTLATVVVGCDCGSKGRPVGDTGPATAKPESKTPPRPPKPPKTVLDSALQAAGGADKLRQASSFRATYQSTPANGPSERGQFWYRPGASRLEIQLQAGSSYQLMTNVQGCVWVYGKVVVVCPDRRSAQAKRYHVAYEASWLWPLRGAEWSFESSTETVDEQVFDTLVARKKGYDFSAKLYLDPKTDLISRIAVPVEDHVGGRHRVGVRSKFADICGSKLALREVGYLGQEKLSTVELSDVQCGSVTAADVAVPKQVTDGTVEEREVEEATLLCHTVASAYDRIGPRFDQINAQAKKRGLRRRREIAWVNFAAPPQAEAAPPRVAEACIEVAAPAPAAPEVSGAFTLRSQPAHRVLTAYGVGPYDEKVAELAGILDAERAKRSLSSELRVRQVGYMVPQDAPVHVRVSELQILLP